jgi:hypothetical protein
MTIEVTVRYKAGHMYVEPWKPTAYFCPCCGQKTVWNRCDGGDYYAGENFACIKCEAEWTWPNEPSPPHAGSAQEWKQRFTQLREAADNQLELPL